MLGSDDLIESNVGKRPSSVHRIFRVIGISDYKPLTRVAEICVKIRIIDSRPLPENIRPRIGVIIQEGRGWRDVRRERARDPCARLAHLYALHPPAMRGSD